jgi:hypothetical protein
MPKVTPRYVMSATGTRLFRDQLGERLAAVLVVLRDRHPRFLLDLAKLRAPVGPFGRAVVADGGLRERGAAEGERECGRGEAVGGSHGCLLRLEAGF